MKILLVDDDIFFQRAISYFLIEMGHTVLMAIDGAKALDVASEHPDIDLVICDMEMPVLMGHEFVLKLKEVYPYNGPTIVIVSGLNPEHSLLRAPGFVFDYYFQKPLNVNLFNETLSEIEQSKKTAATEDEDVS